MKERLIHIALLLVLLLSFSEAHAQYYSWGADSESLKWQRKDSLGITVIYPKCASELGSRLSGYTSAVRPYINFGFRFEPLKWPFVLHPENFDSNGLAMWLPKRIEILSVPAVNGYSMPWLKQLSAHEYRHAVQYTNLRRGWPRVFSWFLGQQGSVFGLLFMPLWGIEGDAVLSETQMSTYGRALQPSFTIQYRAMGNFTLERRNLDKWFCGSFRESIPDHYHIGYQITAYADTKYDENVWDRVVHYAVRNPYVFATTAVGLKKFYHTSVRKLTRETFSELNEYWKKANSVNDSSHPLPFPLRESYTTYSHPISVDCDNIIVLKTTLDTPSEFVSLNRRTGKENRIARTGVVSSRPYLDNGHLWWTEYRRSMLFRQRVNSVLCKMDLSKPRPKTVRKMRRILYPTHYGETLSYVSYGHDGTYTVHGRGFDCRFEIGTEVHGLAYDTVSDALYAIITDDDGMGIAKVTQSGAEIIKKEAYVTLNDLRADSGRLFFNSIASGKDEIHMWDLAEGKEYRITTSRFGSFSGSASGRDTLLMTTYDSMGYRPAAQAFSVRDLTEVRHSSVPENILNPKRKKWDVPNLDTVRFTAGHAASEPKGRRYSKIGGLFNFHSWAPASFNPFSFTGESMPSINYGATVMTQNLLSSMEGYATYGWSRDKGHVFRTALYYYALGIQLGASFAYGGDRQYYYPYSFTYSSADSKYHSVVPSSEYLGKNWELNLQASLPMYFQRGYHTRIMTLSTQYSFSNGMVADLKEWKANGCGRAEIAGIGFRQGLHSLQFGASFQDMVRQAHRDFLPKWGYALSLNYFLNPTDRDFSSMVMSYGKVYLPGFARHHSITLAAAYQHDIGGFKKWYVASNMSFHSVRLLPAGFSSDDVDPSSYFASSFRYSLPVWYPDGGIPSVLYFQRIRLILGFDMASYKEAYFEGKYGVAALKHRNRFICAYGGSIAFDVNFFRLPASGMSTVTLSVYKPQGKKVYVSASLGLPF